MLKLWGEILRDPEELPDVSEALPCRQSDSFSFERTAVPAVQLIRLTLREFIENLIEGHSWGAPPHECRQSGAALASERVSLDRVAQALLAEAVVDKSARGQPSQPHAFSFGL